MKFVGRRKEIEILKRSLSKKPSFTVLFGRRRVGKTTLLQKASTDEKRFFFTFSNSSSKVQMGEFAESFASYISDDLITKISGDWYDLFSYCFEKMEPGSLMILDEFTYAIRSDKKIVSDLQRTWDHIGIPEDHRIVLCGSLMGLMKDEVLSHNSPLYGRRTRDLELCPLSLKESLELFDNDFYGAMAYMILGGMPQYLDVALEHEDLRSLIEEEFLSKRGFFFREGDYLVSQDLGDQRIYNSILRAISLGNTRPKLIADGAGLEQRSIYPYLDSLKRLNWVIRETPMGGPTKNGIYKLNDPMLHLWYALTNKKRQEIEMDVAKYSKEMVHPVLGRLFEGLIRDLIVEYGDDIGIDLDRIGSWWKKEEEIDIVCLNTQKKEVHFIECKFRSLGAREIKKILSDLDRKWKLTDWSNGDYKYVPWIFCLESSVQEDNVISLKDFFKKNP